MEHQIIQLFRGIAIFNPIVKNSLFSSC